MLGLLAHSKTEELGGVSRTPWSCGLIYHVLVWKVEGSNLAAAKNLFQFKSTKNLLAEIRAEEKGTHSSHQSEQ